MGFLSLFIVALMPVIKVLLVTLVGLLLALERINILGPTARNNLNNVLFYVFTPALVGAYLADTVTWEKMVEMWFMPVNIFITFVLGSILGWILVKITRAPIHQHGLIIGCCAAGNLGNLLLIMIPSICDESDSPFGDSSTCTTEGDAYASLSMAIGAVYIWSYVYIIIKLSSDRYKSQSSILSSFDGSFTSTRPSDALPETTPTEATEPLLPSEDQPALEDSPSYKIDVSDNEQEAEVTFSQKITKKFKNFAAIFNLKLIFTPSIVGAVIGFTIGVVSPLRKLMIGDDAPLRSIYGASSLIGEAAIPSMTLIVGANLLKGLRRTGLSVFDIIGIIVVRYALLPGLGIAVIKAARHLGWVGTGSLYQFVLMLQYALPPAMTVGTLTQLFQMGQNDCSVIMLWSYAVAAIFLTLWSTVFMSMVS